MSEKNDDLGLKRAKLVNLLIGISDTLEDYESIDEDLSDLGITKGLGDVFPRGAQYAIMNERRLWREVCEAEMIADELPYDSLIRETKEVLALIHIMLEGCDIPAMTALNDGHEDEAIACVTSRVFAAWEQCGSTLKPLAAKLRVSAEAPDAITDSTIAVDVSLSTKSEKVVEVKPEDSMPSGPVAKPDGWVQSDLVSQARDAKGSFSDSTFTNIRNAAEVKASKKGGEGPQRRFSRSELTKLISAVETGNFQKKKIIADSWRQLLAK